MKGTTTLSYVGTNIFKGKRVGPTFREENFANKARLFKTLIVGLTLLHSERPKLHRVLAVLSAIGLMKLLYQV